MLIEAGGSIRNGRISCDDLVYFGLCEAARDERRSRRQPQISASGLQFPEAADDGANGRVGQMGGIWVAPSAGPAGPFDIQRSELMLDEQYYAGRLVQGRSGDWFLIAFEMNAPGRPFQGRISDPMPVGMDGERLVLRGRAEATT